MGLAFCVIHDEITQPMANEKYIHARDTLPRWFLGYKLVWMFLKGINDMNANRRPMQSDTKLRQIDLRLLSL